MQNLRYSTFVNKLDAARAGRRRGRAAAVPTRQSRRAGRPSAFARACPPQHTRCRGGAALARPRRPQARLAAARLVCTGATAAAARPPELPTPLQPLHPRSLHDDFGAFSPYAPPTTILRRRPRSVVAPRAMPALATAPRRPHSTGSDNAEWSGMPLVAPVARRPLPLSRSDYQLPRPAIMTNGYGAVPRPPAGACRYRAPACRPLPSLRPRSTDSRGWWRRRARGSRPGRSRRRPRRRPRYARRSATCCSSRGTASPSWTISCPFSSKFWMLKNASHRYGLSRLKHTDRTRAVSHRALSVENNANSVPELENKLYHSRKPALRRRSRAARAAPHPQRRLEIHYVYSI
ncbi:hypothetical protein EVAR_32743_1 [Eumeta japonica]|uniref:Uncharacterized protein n=1 Tax=Eumeta variegata TaxID=151549 RepID=A0A4C1XQV6_EUMVA|nr:hypothetical protein EVAR_32743_1 [Eumeta japonica]